MPGLRNILVVIDPSRDNQPALDRLLMAAGQRKDLGKVILFIAPDYELLGRSHQLQTMRRNQGWVKELGAPLTTQAIKYEVFYSWEVEWASSVNELTREYDIDTLMISLYQSDAQQNLLSNEMWDLLRNAGTKILFIREGDANPRRLKILAGIKMQDGTASELNERVLNQLNFAAKISNGDCYVANAYESSSNYPDRARLMELTGLPNDHLFVEQRRPDEVISDAAEKFDADLLVIGIRPRKTVKQLLRGKTIEKILSKAKCDVIAVP